MTTTQDLLKKLKEMLDAEQEIERLEKELENARQEYKRHKDPKFGWKDEVEQLQQALKDARERLKGEQAAKMSALGGEARRMGAEHPDGDSKDGADGIGDNADDAADAFRGAAEKSGSDQAGRIAAYEKLLKLIIDLEDLEHKDVKERTKHLRRDMASDASSLEKARSAWIKIAKNSANNINDNAARKEAQDIADDLKDGNVPANEIKTKIDRLKELIDGHVTAANRGNGYADAWNDLDEARTRLRETREALTKVLQELDDLEGFGDEVEDWIDDLSDDPRWDGVRKLLKAKLRSISDFLKFRRTDRKKGKAAVDDWDSVSLPGGPPQVPTPGRSRRVLLGIGGLGLGLVLVAVTLLGFDGPRSADSVSLEVATPTVVTHPTVPQKDLMNSHTDRDANVEIKEAVTGNGTLLEGAITTSVTAISDFDSIQTPTPNAVDVEDLTNAVGDPTPMVTEPAPTHAAQANNTGDTAADRLTIQSGAESDDQANSGRGANPTATEVATDEDLEQEQPGVDVQTQTVTLEETVAHADDHSEIGPPSADQDQVEDTGNPIATQPADNANAEIVSDQCAVDPASCDAAVNDGALTTTTPASNTVINGCSNDLETCSELADELSTVEDEDASLVSVAVPIPRTDAPGEPVTP